MPNEPKNPLPEGWRGSTALNSTIQTYEDVANRVKAQLGFPVTDLEITDQQMAMFIDEGLEWFTQYSGRERQWLLFCDDVYVEGCGVKLDDIVRTSSMRSECFQYLSSCQVTATNQPFDILSTESAYLSVNCFNFPANLLDDPTLTEGDVKQGQQLKLKFDKDSPWDAANICDATGFRIRPDNTDCASLTSNPLLPDVDLMDLLITYPQLEDIIIPLITYNRVLNFNATTSAVFPHDPTKIEFTATHAQLSGLSGVYPTDGPSITLPGTVSPLVDGVLSFTTTSTITGGDPNPADWTDIRFNMIVNGTEKHFTSGSWEDADGTYAQTNDQLTVNCALSSYVFTVGDTLGWTVFLRSEVSHNTFTPQISSLSYDYVVFDTRPVSALDCELLTAIPTSYWDTTAFYPETELCGFPVTACVEIKNGCGVIYPTCNKDLINACSALSGQWTIDPNFDWVDLGGNVISGENGLTATYADLALSGCNSVIIPGLPTCNVDGTLSLKENTGYYATFCLCNSAVDTNGQWETENVQFVNSYLPPEGALDNYYCGVKNSGFTITKTLTAHEDCVESSKGWVKVDVDFVDCSVNEVTGTVVEVMSGGFDTDLNFRRKVIDTFSIDYTPGNGGQFGANLLFSFDYGVVANAFGFDLQGNRNLYRNGYDMLSYELARGFIDRVRRMVNYVSFEFNADTQYLKLTPEPRQYTGGSSSQSGQLDVQAGTVGGCRRCYVVGVYVEKPLVHLIRQHWVQEFVKARTMQTIGEIRAKYGNVTLYGGSSVTGESMVTMGNSEYERLMRELRDDLYYTEPPMFCVG